MYYIFKKKSICLFHLYLNKESTHSPPSMFMSADPSYDHMDLFFTPHQEQCLKFCSFSDKGFIQINASDFNFLHILVRAFDYLCIYDYKNYDINTSKICDLVQAFRMFISHIYSYIFLYQLH